MKDSKTKLIYLTRFFGGKENGPMIQLTISNKSSNSYVQLTKEQVKELALTLNESFNYDKYPSE